MVDRRLADLRNFYDLIQLLNQNCRGARMLATCSGRLSWPSRGVYFFMEDGESRTDSGDGPRIVRVGTHALTGSSATTLWRRLSQHRGQGKSGGGHHRGSIFRLLIGTAVIEQSGRQCPTWGQGNNASADIKAGEFDLEREVSRIIGAMPFLWLPVEDAPSVESLRGYIERNSIALLSNIDKPLLDPSSIGWLGQFCDRVRVRRSGLWNQNHTEQQYDPSFLSVFERLIHEMKEADDCRHSMRRH
jgi:hypothetical protein